MKSIDQIKRENDLATKFTRGKVLQTISLARQWVMEAQADDDLDFSGLVAQTILEQLELRPELAIELTRDALDEIERCAVLLDGPVQ